MGSPAGSGEGVEGREGEVEAASAKALGGQAGPLGGEREAPSLRPSGEEGAAGKAAGGGEAGGALAWAA